MSIHLAFKFQNFGRTSFGSGLTIDLHNDVIKQHGSVWWCRTTGMSVDRLEALRKQIADEVNTYAFLYEVDTPKEIHPDQKRWYRAKILEIQLGQPKNLELIPEYGRHTKDYELSVRITEIEKLEYKPGTTPRMSGQAPMRHVALIGSPMPENLVSPNDKSIKICSEMGSDLPTVLKEQLEITNAKNPDQLGLAMKVIDLQEELISLQQQVEDLKSYKEYYNKILGTDYLFSSEKLFETWIQDNMHRIFPELEVIDRQPNISWKDGKFGRLDLLAMNKESKDLAIIEVKTRKRSKKSGYDQYLRYTSWVKRNIDLLKTKYEDFGVQPSIEPQFIIISDYVDEEMKAICKDHGITLMYIFGGLGFEKAA